MITEKITATWREIMEDGSSAAKFYLDQAIEAIDSRFGKGYSEKHPELVGSFMQAASRETHGAVIGKCIQQNSEEISESLSVLTEIIVNNNND